MSEIATNQEPIRRGKLVVMTMTVGPGEIGKYYREQMAALVYGAMER